MASSGISSSSKDNTLSSDVSLAESMESSNSVSAVPGGTLSDELLTSFALFVEVSASTTDVGSGEFESPSDGGRGWAKGYGICEYKVHFSYVKQEKDNTFQPV
jgi:hypothetical protein